MWHIKLTILLSLSLPNLIFGLSSDAKLGPPFGGSLCAFADINLDRFTDLIVKKNDKEIAFHYASSDTLRKSTQPDFEQRGGINISSKSDKSIIECAVADFDGDARLDVLVTLGAQGKQADMMRVCFGTGNIFDCDPKYVYDDLVGFPSIIDYNVDGRHDLVYRKKDKNDRLTCIYDISRASGKMPTIEDCFILSNNKTLYDNFAYAYVDILNATDGEAIPTDQKQDLSAEFVIGVHDGSGKLDLQIWQKEEKLGSRTGWHLATSTKTPVDPVNELLATSEEFKFFGRLITADFDADGRMDLVLPACRSDKCADDTELTLMLWTGDEKKWNSLTFYLQEDTNKKQWHILFDDTGSFSLRPGDIDMDGFPDLLITLQSGGKQQVFTVRNKACAETGCLWPRRFAVQFSPYLMDSEPPDGTELVLATFFDLFEDGVLDVVYEYRSTSNPEQRNFRFIAAEATGDTTFLKAEVYTPSMIGESDVGEKAIAHPGATLGYSMVKDTDLDLLRGDKIRGVHTQLSQVTGRALQLPFVIFGLGRSPNFVEALVVGVPSVPRRWHEFSQIVPNSRLFIVPSLDSNSGWLGRLYVTPSRLVLLSFAGLCAICAACLFVIVVLWYREYKVDEREKQAQTHRFHFDAM